MIEKVDNLDIYNNSAIIIYKRIPKKIISWITILCIILITFIIFSFIPFNIYKPYIGYVEIKDGESYFISKLEYSNFPIIQNKKLYIKGIKYDYEVIDISDNLVLKIDLDDSIKIQNNLITINVLENRTTLFNIIIRKIKKGLI